MSEASWQGADRHQDGCSRSRSRVSTRDMAQSATPRHSASNGRAPRSMLRCESLHSPRRTRSSSLPVASSNIQASCRWLVGQRTVARVMSIAPLMDLPVVIKAGPGVPFTRELRRAGATGPASGMMCLWAASSYARGREESRLCRTRVRPCCIPWWRPARV
jgi:hypothetical protein